jgi:hypothetical protein
MQPCSQCRSPYQPKHPKRPAVPTEKSIREQFEPLFIQKSSAALCSNTYLLDPIPDESRTHNIQQGRPTGECSKPLEQQDVIDFNSDGMTKCMTSETENITVSSQQGASDTVTKPTEPTDETRLAILTELLANLPEVDRRELIADLPASDRVAIARQLIGSGEQAANPSEGQ